MKDLISVIIPVYNVEKYVERCLDSVIAQTYKNIEIIVIDDGSVDSSVSIIKKFKDKRIKLIVKGYNSGQSDSRNIGLSLAKGKYIGFIDSDDYVDLNYFEKMHNAAKQNDAEIVMVGMCSDDGYNKIYDRIMDNVYVSFYDKLKTAKNGSTCNKLFKYDFIRKNKISFPTGLFWEDNVFILHAVYYAKKMATVSDVFYYYVKNQSSTTRSEANIKKRSDDSITVIKQMMDFAKAKQFSKLDIDLLVNFCFSNIVAKSDMKNRAYVKKLDSAIGIHGVLNKRRPKFPFWYKIIGLFLGRKKYKEFKNNWKKARYD